MITKSTPAPSDNTAIVQEFEPGNELRMKLLVTIAETFKWLGYTSIRARFSGYPVPGEIQGTIANHRPDLLARQNDSRHTPLILEVVTAKEWKDQDTLLSRLSLFNSARPIMGCELHLVVPNMKFDGEYLEDRLKQLCQSHGFKVNKIWSV